MRVVFCNTIKSWGGGEKWHCESAIELAKQGHDVSFILHRDGVIAEKIKNHSIKPIHFPITNLSFLNPIKYIRLIVLFKRIKADVLIVNMPAELKIIACAAKMAGVKKIVYRRGSDIKVKKSALNKYLLEKTVTHIIANSTATKSSLLATGLAIEPKIKVINNGISINTSAFDSVPNNEVPVISAAGRLVGQKGFDYLLDVAIELRKRGLNFQILIAGEGPEREALASKIALNNLDNYVLLKGFITDMATFLRGSDLFVLTSRYEGFGYVMVEAMAAKKAVVAFNLSSVTDIIIEEETGFMVAPFNIPMFADKVEALLNDKSKRLEMGERGYLRAVKQFSHKTKTEELIAWLKS